MKQGKKWMGRIVVTAVLLLILSMVPIRSALEFAIDEGYESMKALLVCKGFHLYTQIWDDQPPLFTLILSLAFKLIDPSIFVARVVTVGFSCLLFLSLHELVQRSSSIRSALLASFFLVASPAVVQLSTSVMQEVPTMALGLASVLPLAGQNRSKWPRLVISGAIMGLALEMKFTAAMLIPAIFGQIAVQNLWLKTDNQKIPTDFRANVKATSKDILIWCVGIVATFIPVALAFAKGSFDLAWKAHATGGAVQGFGSPEENSFNFKLLIQHSECVGLATLGLFWTFRGAAWKEFVFPGIFLLTCLTIHIFHRPWWDYYYLHLAIPLAWFAGIALNHILSMFSRSLLKEKIGLNSAAVLKVLLPCAVLAFTFARSEIRLEQTLGHLRKTPSLNTDVIVAAMKRYSSQTQWAYCDHIIYPFHANCAAPPELAVVSFKRIWSGQITPASIIETCKRYMPEQIVLKTKSNNDLWHDLIGRDYTILATNNMWSLFVAERAITSNQGK